MKELTLDQLMNDICDKENELNKEKQAETKLQLIKMNPKTLRDLANELGVIPGRLETTGVNGHKFMDVPIMRSNDVDKWELRG